MCSGTGPINFHWWQLWGKKKKQIVSGHCRSGFGNSLWCAWNPGYPSTSINNLFHYMEVTAPVTFMLWIQIAFKFKDPAFHLLCKVIIIVIILMLVAAICCSTLFALKNRIYYCSKLKVWIVHRQLSIKFNLTAILLASSQSSLTFWLPCALKTQRRGGENWRWAAFFSI